MITTVIQLITGAIGSVGFGILFHMKNKYLPGSSWWFFKLDVLPAGEGTLGRGFSAIITGWILLQMCMRKFLQESAKRLLLPFSSHP